MVLEINLFSCSGSRFPSTLNAQGFEVKSHLYDQIMVSPRYPRIPTNGCFSQPELWAGLVSGELQEGSLTSGSMSSWT
ncbi:hypothetical protein DPEC_G00206340 [Dallia pectoralis]|uniref:Uncharacterized protein n=1 Tax=Dallia pectoralis TaxID=75939 RepID=A0ACC2G4Q7_DALPE|nr:hypothetical protein DPEC_G00206340 [Dallia pectoralis]